MPDRLGLRLYSRHSVEDDDSAVKYAHRSLDFHRKINMPRRIYNIYTVLVGFIVLGIWAGNPKTRSGRRGYRNAPLSFLLHPVHNCLPFVHLADSVRNPRVKQNTLGNRGLTGVYMSNNAYVSVFFYRIFPHVLPAKMRESPVRLRHSMSIVFFLYRSARILGRLHNFISQFLGHSLSLSGTCR